MLKLYENIKYYRKKNGLTQDELARRAGYTDRSSIAKIERGVVDLSQSKIAQFAEIFGITPSDLMGWEEEMKKDPEVMAERHFEILMDEDFVSMFDDFRKLDGSKRKIVKDLVHSLADTEA